MNDSFITALNTQKSTTNWMDVIASNMTNVYTPGFREQQVNFKTFLGGAISDDYDKKMSQGKSTPGTSNENLFLEGKGFFLVKNAEGKSIYTRLGEFTFDKEGVYRDRSGNTVQGYILNDKGEIMQGTKSVASDLYQETAMKGGALDIPTTNIKMWIDPNNGKYLGKYDDYEIKGTVLFMVKQMAANVQFLYTELLQEIFIILRLYMNLNKVSFLKLKSLENR